MSKIGRLLFLIFPAFVMACACNTMQDADEYGKDVQVELFASLSPISKVCMDDDGVLTWKSGDEIGVWDGYTLQKHVVTDADISADSRTVSVALPVSSEAHRLVVLFPYDSTDSFSADGSMNVAASRVAVGNGLRSQLKTVGVCGVKDKSVTLKNVNAILKFGINSDLVKGISLEGNCGETLSGRVRIDPSDPCRDCRLESAAYEKLYLTNMSGKGIYYLGLLPGVNLGKGWKIQVFNQISMSSSTLLGEVRNTDPLCLSVGTFADLGMLEYVEPEIGQNSNCYHISAPGKYSLALCKGNSEEVLSSATSAAVLWESVGAVIPPAKGTVVSEVSLDADRGVLDYTVTSTPGNAVVAALDAVGNILWSWHIWNVQRELTEVTLGNGRVVIDSNVGALAPEDAGLMYQWGRKDPFLGASAPDGSGAALVQATAQLNNGSPVQSSNTVGTVDYTVSHPMQWIQSVAASAWDWFYNKLEDGLWDAEKTVYDPCPVGYRVIDTSVWTGLDRWNLPLSGVLGGSGKNWNVVPGQPTNYWASNAPGNGNTTANAICVGTDGKISDVKTTRGLGLPVRCVKE